MSPNPYRLFLAALAILAGVLGILLAAVGGGAFAAGLLAFSGLALLFWLHAAARSYELAPMPSREESGPADPA